MLVTDSDGIVRTSERHSRHTPVTRLRSARVKKVNEHSNARRRCSDDRDVAQACASPGEEDEEAMMRTGTGCVRSGERSYKDKHKSPATRTMRSRLQLGEMRNRLNGSIASADSTRKVSASGSLS